MSDPPPTFGKRGASPPAAPDPPPPALSAAHLELAAAARAALGGAGPPEGTADAYAARPLPRDDDDIRAFIGPRWPAYRALWARMKDAPRLTSRRSLSAGVFSSLWLLYRKQYRTGAAILLAQAAMMQTDAIWTSLADLAIAVFVGRYGMSMVLVGGARKVALLRAAEASPEIATIRIGAAGGVNWVAALSGAALLIGIAAASFAATFDGLDLETGDMRAILRALDSR